MLSSAKITTQSWRYYVTHERCLAAEYFLGHDAELGAWLGRGLGPLGLEPGGAVREGQLEALFGRALHPETAVRLGRAWRSDGVTGYDLTFSAPKSVSALMERVIRPSLTGAEGTVSSGQSPVEQQLSLDLQISNGAYRQGEASAGHEPLLAAGPAGLDARDAVVAAHDTALRTALAYLDRHAGLSRRGTDGTDQISTDGFTVAAFTHYTSREGDPQLHTHALVLNKVRCVDGTWRTLDGHELYAHKKSAGMIYQAVLRNELHATLGVQFGEVSKDGQAEILGIPEPLLEKWSKRAQHVNVEAAKAIAEFEKTLGRSLTGDERAAVTKTAVLKTRPDKTHESQESLAGRWTAEAAELGIDLSRLLPAAQRAAQAADPAVVRTADELAGAALLAAGRSRAVFGRAEVAGHVAALLPTSGLSATELLARIESLTDRALALADAVEVGAAAHGATPRMSDARFATLEILSAEQRILELARTGQRTGAGQVGFDVIRQVLATVQPSEAAACVRAGLDRSQVEALLHLLSHGDALDVLTAPAGAGKTATLGACAQAWHTAGYRVIGLAPSARAAAELQTAITGTPTPDRQPDPAVIAGSRTDTLAKWLHTRAQQPDLDSLDPARTDRAGWARLDARTVLVVDEASMASTLDLDTVTRAAQAAGAKVVLVGDPGQIGVINGPGGMLAALVRDGHAVALDTIHRFSQQWEKQASLALRDGSPDALQPYQQHDRLHPCADGDSAADAVFAHWQHATTDQGLDALMLARTRLDVDALNARARAAAQADGRITGPVVALGGRDWQSGDLLRARRNNRALPVGDGHVRNGDRYRVLGTSPDGGLIVEDLSGRGRTILPAAYVAKHAEYGWATTIDGSQGATCDLGLLLVRPGLDREHLYVALTRGRHGNHAYLTPDPTLAPDQHHPTGPGRPRDEEQLQRACLDMLQTALTVSGAQDAASTALERARSTATTPRPAGDQASGADAAVIRRQTEPPEPDPTSAERRRLDQARVALARLQAERQQTRQTQRDLHRQRRQVAAALDGTPRWAAGRRRSHTRQLTELDTQQHAVIARLAELDQKLDTTAQQIRTLHQHAAKATTPAAAPPVKTPAGGPKPIPAPIAVRRPKHAPERPDATQGLGRPDLQPPHPGRPRPAGEIRPRPGPDRGLDHGPDR